MSSIVARSCSPGAAIVLETRHTVQEAVPSIWRCGRGLLLTNPVSLVIPSSVCDCASNGSTRAAMGAAKVIAAVQSLRSLAQVIA